MRFLPPLILREHYYLPIEREIQRLFNMLIYRPLVNILNKHLRVETEIFNSINSDSKLLLALRTGRIWYADGKFHGRFSASTSKELMKLGASFNAFESSWTLESSLVPVDLKFAQNEANARYEALRHEMLQAINKMDVNTIDLLSKAPEEYAATISGMERDLNATIPPDDKSYIDAPATARSRIVIEAKLSETQKTAIATDWGNNLDLYIKGWAEDNILKLREQIQPHVLAGGRAEGLVKTIQDNYGVSTRKAKFLARQETALLMSKFQETRYKDMGIKRFKWSTSMDSRVRHDHKELQGKIFDFDSPPVVDRRTGKRALPGGDWNCRCVAIPLVE